MHHTPLQRLTVDTPRRIAASLHTRRAALDTPDETGAQAAEYALLGGVSAAVCLGLIAVFTKTTLLKQLLTALIEALITIITSKWGL